MKLIKLVPKLIPPFSSVFIVDFEQVNVSWVGGIEMQHLEQMSYYVLTS